MKGFVGRFAGWKSALLLSILGVPSREFPLRRKRRISEMYGVFPQDTTDMLLDLAVGEERVE